MKRQHTLHILMAGCLAQFYGFPSWAVAGWAFAVWGVLAGSVGLLLRHRWSLWAFVIAFARMVFSSIFTLGLSNGAEIMGTAGVIFGVVNWIVAIFLVVYAWKQTKTGVLR